MHRVTYACDGPPRYKSRAVSTAAVSRRLQRAAAAERAQLGRELERLRVRQDELCAELERVETSMAQIDERFTLLDRLAPVEPGVSGTTREPSPVGAGMDGRDHPSAEAVLRGTVIRETAVRLLAERPEGDAPIHYREWFGLVEAAGLRVAGKDPLAVFLTQVKRSPVVRKALSAGVYELDRGAPAGLRREIAVLQTELRRLADGDGGGEPGGRRQRREAVLRELGRRERRLEEADRVLSRSGPRPALRVAG